MFQVPQRATHGISTAPRDHPLGNYRNPNPFAICRYENDFLEYLAADWTVTTSTGSSALAAGNGGRILQTTSAGANDIQANAKNPAPFQINLGNQFWFMWRGQVDNLLAAMQIGVQAGGTAFAPTDGVYFTKAGAASAVNLNIRKAGVSTVVPMTGLTVAAATDFILAFYFDGRINGAGVYAFAGPVSALVGPTSMDQFGNSPAQNWTSLAGTQTLTNLPTATNLTPLFGVQASTAAIRTMNTDYLLAASEIVR